MTILTLKVGQGATRRCDGSCHHAAAKVCKCICGGKYHGKGGYAAALLARDWLGPELEQARAVAQANDQTLDITMVVRDAMNQMALPLEA